VISPVPYSSAASEKNRPTGARLATPR
jgi:hypothetical protein